MKAFYRILRFILVTLLVLPMAVPAILYIMLSFPSVQHQIGNQAERELSKLFGTDVTIGEVSIAPFNRVTLSDVTFLDDNGETALYVSHLGAGISIGESLWNERIIISYAEMIDLHCNLYRDSIGAPLNIQPIIDRFKKNDNKEPSKFDLAINMVVIRRSSIDYNVKNLPAPTPRIFDINHISVSDFRADLCAPRISNGKFEVEIKRLAAIERSGFSLNEFTSDIVVDTLTTTISNFKIALPQTEILLGEISATSPLNKSFNPATAITSPISILDGSHIALKDLTPFIPKMENIDATFYLEFMAEGTLDDLIIKKLNIADNNNDFWLEGTGNAHYLTKGRDSLSFDLREFDLGLSVEALAKYSAIPGSPLSRTYNSVKPFTPLGVINMLGEISGSPKHLDFNGEIRTECGNIGMDCGIFRISKNSPLKIDGVIETEKFNPSLLDKNLSKLTTITFDAIFDIAIARNGNIDGTTEINIPHVEFGGYTYTDISGNAKFSGNHVDGKLASNSPLLDFSIHGGGDISGKNPKTEFFANINNISLTPFIADGPYKDFSIAVDIDASILGRTPDNVTGWVKISDLNFSDGKDKTISLSYIDIDAAKEDSLRNLSLHSVPIDADIKGVFSFASLPTELKKIVGSIYPALIPTSDMAAQSGPTTDMNLNINLKEDTVLSRFFKLPVDIIYPVKLNAMAKAANGLIGFELDAPYLRQKNKLIENTAISGFIDAANDSSLVTIRTSFPTKNGMMDLNVTSGGGNDSILTDILWKINRKEDFHGQLNFLTTFNREEESNELTTDINFHSTKLIFNDSAWTVNPGYINIRPGYVSISDFGGGRAGQSLSINGIAGTDSTNRVVVSLNHIDLDYIFETLNIGEAVMFGGRATGDFYGSALLSKEPVLYTPSLKVQSLKYNFCEMGDGDIKSHWDNSTKSIGIDAIITQRNGSRSIINGYIRPFTEELDFKFNANKAPVGFMLPFMSAFTSKIAGEVSGNAHLFGTFKDLDMTGDIFLQDLSMKLDFTNTTYTTTDSVHITPGLIKFSDVELKDKYGKTAKLSGYVAHEFFHNPTFKFSVNNAKDFLVYDVEENATEDPWYGRIFGNGSASVTGVPGKVDIGVTMTTAPKSTFTFVLSDAENAMEYDFITLRDRDAAKKDSIAALNAPPLIVRQLKERIKQQESSPSLYAMEFNVDITPSATMNLIMDPVGGDKIVANGSGHLRMTYSSDGDLRMYGDYTLQRGSYNFTLQDIIIKDFTIKEGSRISILGDPYAAQLNIAASYTVNANLSDLDESFLEDKELNRTNVPVEALLNVRGDMRQPELAFDLDFPTLTRDTYRKVRSIVSTEDMMNRQIIYLLALNRFYTPDYMSTTHGNELVSVASSTISSRLGSMLGQLSDNWSIAPNIRSDRGDFSDVEVDVALSSHLLNNRLLFNGNFGYRDKALNNNSFIGDFDIRYLLNRAGTIQLKAYNRYNDQNYYLKSALTTQGVGIVFKRDFDNIFSFLRRKKKAENKSNSEENENKENSDSVTIVIKETEEIIPNSTKDKKN